MKQTSAVFLVLSLVAGASPSPSVRRIPDFPPDVKARGDRLWNTASPAVKSWVSQQAASVERGRGQPDTSQIASAARARWPVLGNRGGGDVEALVSLVLMQAAKSAQDDLRKLLAEMQNAEERKKALREAFDRLKRQESALEARLKTRFSALPGSTPCHPPDCGLTPAELSAILSHPISSKLPVRKFQPVATVADLNALESQMKNELDSMSEMGETESLRLQMAMDRLSKMMTTLSNVLKKISDTSQSIVQNMK
jgi:hypothetical protein